MAVLQVIPMQDPVYGRSLRMYFRKEISQIWSGRLSSLSSSAPLDSARRQLARVSLPWRESPPRLPPACTRAARAQSQPRRARRARLQSSVIEDRAPPDIRLTRRFPVYMAPMNSAAATAGSSTVVVENEGNNQSSSTWSLMWSRSTPAIC